MGLKEGRFVLGTFRSERMRVLYRSCQNDRLCLMLVQVHIHITPPHTPLPVFWRIGKRTIPYLRRALDRWRRDSSMRRVWFRSRPGSPMKEDSIWVPPIPYASTLSTTPKRSSLRDVGTSSYRYHTATGF
ncbi:uncharacterized protein TNCV_612171 [Trichonephila clavipes]|nr:uncharacterized protein TNCV_612171 [Trichonephila clavipes]